VAGIVAALAIIRYGPLVGEVRAVRDAASVVMSQTRTLGPADLDRESLDRLRVGMGSVETHLEPVRTALVDDPLIAIARQLPFSGEQVRAADELVAAADDVVAAGQRGIAIAERVVALREAEATDPSTAMLPGLVGIVASSRDEVDGIAASLDEAIDHLRAIPAGAVGPIQDARDLIAEPLETYRPILESYRELDDVVPGVLGWDGQKRYLVLAQNPAELRPAGGYAGTIGTLGIDDAVVVEQVFRDVYDFDRQEGLPWVEPPEELAHHLLGDDQAWRLADAAWSPDFPTSARKALELYELQTGDADFDGVIAITTFALDRLLEVVGPVTVDEYDVTVEPGDVTLTLLGATRGTPTDLEGRKDVLDALAREVIARLMTLPPEEWPALQAAFEDIGSQKMAQVWLADEGAQRVAADAGWGGAVRQDPGDYVYVAESNVAPTSKYNLVVDRSDSLVVRLAEDGAALSSLRLDWRNDAGKRGEPYRALRAFSQNTDGWYGSFVRLLAPADSELLTVTGEASDELRGAELVAQEAGRSVFGTYLLMPPGDSTLTWLWETPGAATAGEDGWTYDLVIQKQPGARPLPLAVRIDLPEGATVIEAPEDAVVADGRVRLERSLERDQVVRLRYDLPALEDAPRSPDVASSAAPSS
jgi:hypothetical protein